GPWRDQADILTADPSLQEATLWAPYALPRDDGSWTMYFYAGPAPDMPLRGVRRADSADLSAWHRQGTAPSPALRAPCGRGALGPPGGRDPMVLQVGDHWLLYSVGVDGDGHGQIVATTNHSLEDPAGWSELVPVLTDPEPSFGWGNLESPFVARYAGRYYLFV